MPTETETRTPETTTPETTTPETKTRPQEETDTETLTRLLPPYRVLLHNDDHNDMLYVVRSLLKAVPKLTRRDAQKIMLLAHLRGVALVIVCPKELAEFYCERLTSFGLTATMERQ